MNAVLEASGMRVARGRRVLLDGFDVAVAGGEVVRVAGPNGSGKSSLLRVLAGVVAPRAGRVVRHGRCAYVPERVILPAGMAARRWLRVMARVRDGEPARLEDELDRRCGVLSKGQLQRVALADALESGAALLVLDEPWTGLDAGASERLTARLGALTEAGAAVVFTDHAATAGLAATRTISLGAAPDAPSARIVLVRDGHREELVVALPERDALLAERLAQGWGVESVRPA